jgi:type VI secretion system secreted protein VgrG
MGTALRTPLRAMELRTPLGDDRLLFRTMQAAELLGRPFEYEIDALALRDDVDPDRLLGELVTVALELPDGGSRFFNGHVARFGPSGMVGRYFRYRLTVRPWLWLLTRTADCRIFQGRTVPEIVREVFAKYPAATFEFRLTERYPQWEYCVQYRESDFNFVSRLLEQEGIHYFFEHAADRHTLVLCDSGSKHTECTGYERLRYVPAGRAARHDEEHVSEWLFSREIQPGIFTLADFDFTRPGVDLKVQHRLERGHKLARAEVFDYPGEYRLRDEGEHYVRSRLEELQCRHHLCRGATNARGPGVGQLFELAGHGRADQNGQYLILAADYRLEYGEYEAMEGAGAEFSCSFEAMPSRETYRPARTTPKPIVQGPQTAIVVGPAGDEIHTDEHGRVKVQFHWDRYGARNQDSSCWVRVSHPCAGKGWGAIAIPRIGQEVIVDFLEGDPDQPIITGRVYNGDQRPPYVLPLNKTQTGI